MFSATYGPKYANILKIQHVRMRTQTAHASHSRRSCYYHANVNDFTQALPAATLDSTGAWFRWNWAVKTESSETELWQVRSNSTTVCVYKNSCSTSALLHLELNSVCGSPDGSGRVAATQTTAKRHGFGLGVECAAWLGGARGRRGSL